MATARRRPATRPAPVAAAERAAAAPRTRARTPAAPPPTPQGVDLTRRLTWEYVDITDIVPYEFNPRDNSQAIAAVANSIRAFGFLIPVVIDANNVLVAGHTRVEAAKSLNMLEVPSVRADYLTPAQINAFRLIDNKVAEQARWDQDLLAQEVQALGGLGLDWTQFGWTQEEVDCLSEVVAADCLTGSEVLAQAEITNEEQGTSQRRAPTQARFVLGEIVFFTTAQEYRIWSDGIRALFNFDEQAIATELKRRLGILTT